MTEDNKPVVLLKEKDYILSVIKSNSTNTTVFDFKLDDDAYAMGVVAERFYLDCFDFPTIKCLAKMLDFLKEEYGNVKIEIRVTE